MKTVLFVKSSELPSCSKKLAGVMSIARKHGWNVQAAEPLRSEETARQLLGLWRRTRKPIRTTYPPLKIVRRESTRRLAKYDKDVSEALELIRREACGGLTARDVFRLFSCSRRMAELRFRAAIGRSVLEEVRAVRLARAKDLLSGPPLKLEALANFCGYRSAAAFSIFFKAETGETPSAWRKRETRTARSAH